MPQKLTRTELITLAKNFCSFHSKAPHPELFGVTDGKAVGTYVEHLFQALIFEKYDIGSGSSAKGIDLPGINIDIKVTSNPQGRKCMGWITICCCSFATKPMMPLGEPQC